MARSRPHPNRHGSKTPACFPAGLAGDAVPNPRDSKRPLSQETSPRSIDQRSGRRPPGHRSDHGIPPDEAEIPARILSWSACLYHAPRPGPQTWTSRTAASATRRLATASAWSTGHNTIGLGPASSVK